MREGWQIKKLGDLFDITSSKRVFKSEWKNRGVPFYRAREIVRLAKHGVVNNDLFISDEMYNDYAKRYGIPKEGDLMVTGVGTLGVCYLVRRDDKFYFKDGNIIWLKKKRDIDSRFVQYAFESPSLKEHIGNSAGATVGTYTITKAKETRIPVPPIPEQKRIVAILDEAFAGLETAVANTEKNLADARALFESYRNSIFSTQHEKWIETRLGDVAKTQYGLSKPMNEIGQGFKIFRMGEVQDGKLVDTGKMKFADIDRDEFEKYRLQGNDVLFNRTNSFELVGKVGIFQLKGEYCFASYLIRVLPDKNILLPEFLNHLMCSNIFQSAIKKKASRSINQANINATILSNEVIRFPQSLKKQTSIVEKLDTLREEAGHLQSIYHQKLTALAELKQSLLQKAFSGELTANPESPLKEAAA